MKNLLNKYSVLLHNPILVYFLLLFGISLLAIASSYPLSQTQYPLNNNFVLRQLIFFMMGSLVLIFVLILGMERIRILRWWIYGFCLLLLILIYFHAHVPGISFPWINTVGGATRWLNLDPIPMSLQPSEFMRIALIIVVADLIQKHNQRYPDSKRTSKTDFTLISKVLLVIIPPAFLIYRQPDSGITILILVTTAIMLLGAGIKWRYILTVAGVAAVAIALFITIASNQPEFLIDVVGLEPYQVRRFSGWFDPFGTASEEGHQLSLGLAAIGSGGLFGNGFQSGIGSFPESHTDFIFAIIGKDFGLFGAIAVILLYVLFNFEILNTAALNRGQYNSSVCVGIFASLIGQKFWNIGMCLGIVPISGVTLPFISHGGSSVLASMILLGLILSAYVEGAKIKHSNANYQEHIIYLKSKAYLKEKPQKLQKN